MHTLVRNGLLLSTLTIISLPLSYFIRLFLSQHLSIDEYGLFYAMIGFYGLLQSFNDLGFSETQIYFIPKYIAQNRLDKIKAVLKTQFMNQLLTTFVIGAILAWTAPWFVTHFFHAPDAVHVFKVFILFFIFNDFLQNVQILFFSYQEIKYSGSLEPLRMFLITILLLVSISFFKFDLITLAWIWVGVYGALAVVFFVIFMLKHQDVLKAKHYPVKNIYKEFIPFILPTLFSNNIAILFSKGTETALVIIKGVTDTALYNIARPISNLALAVASPVAGLLKPYISQIDETQDKSSIKRLILLVLNTGVFILIPFSILLSLNAKESIVFLFGAKYAQAELTLRFMAFEIFFDIMNSFVFGIVFGLGLQKKRAKVLYIASFICFILSISLIPVFGPVGVAVANLAYSCIGTVGAVYIIRQKISFDLPVRKYATIIPLILIVIVSQLLLRNISVPDSSQQFLLFMIKVVISLSLYYGIGIFVFKIVDFNVIKKILSYLIPAKVRQLMVKQ